MNLYSDFRIGSHRSLIESSFSNVKHKTSAALATCFCRAYSPAKSTWKRYRPSELRPRFAIRELRMHRVGYETMLTNTCLLCIFLFRETRKTSMAKLPNRQLVLKPQDFYLLLALAAHGDQGTTYPELAALAGLSMSEVHGALKRAEAARLLFFDAKRPRILLPAFKEFLFHGAKYVFPAVRGSMVAGVPTAHAAPPLQAHIAPSADPAPVWPSIEGSVRGIALIPLYPSAPAAALRNCVFRAT